MSWFREREEEEKELVEAEGLEARAELVQISKEGSRIKELRAARDACRTGGKVRSVSGMRCVWRCVAGEGGETKSLVVIWASNALKATCLQYSTYTPPPPLTHSHPTPVRSPTPTPHNLGSTRPAQEQTRRCVGAASKYHASLHVACKHQHHSCGGGRRKKRPQQASLGSAAIPGKSHSRKPTDGLLGV